MNSQPQILYLAIAAVIGGVLGFSISQSIQQQDVVYVTEYISEESGEKVVKEQQLPLLSEMLLNPIFYEWWASASGTVVKKTEDSVTLEKDGNRTVIKVSPAFTKYFFQVPEAGQSVLASFEDVKIGSKLRGGILMSRTGTLGLAGEEDVAVASTFVIIE